MFCNLFLKPVDYNCRKAEINWKNVEKYYNN